jgi:hypothetical protein
MGNGISPSLHFSVGSLFYKVSMMPKSPLARSARGRPPNRRMTSSLRVDARTHRPAAGTLTDLGATTVFAAYRQIKLKQSNIFCSKGTGGDLVVEVNAGDSTNASLIPQSYIYLYESGRDSFTAAVAVPLRARFSTVAFSQSVVEEGRSYYAVWR